MTERLYYTDPYRTEFTGRVVETLTWDGHPAVILDRTAFYPASGGQPADRGQLNDVPVRDVAERATDSAVVHVLSGDIAGGEVTGIVDWERRFDHMQQHTGQHILSAACEQVLGAATVGFHLGAESSTIDLDLTPLEMEAVVPAETQANEVVWDDRAVAIDIADDDTLDELGVERPADVDGPVRLMLIPGAEEDEPPFDVNPCGGTHVARTGEIGLIKITGLERRGDETRVSFVCGERALRDYRVKNGIIAALAGRLTVGYWELEEAVERLQDENRQLRHAERDLRERLLDAEADRLAASAAVRRSYRVVGRVWEGRAPDELRTLARKLAERPRVLALLFSVTDRTHLCFARADELELDANALLQEACSRLDGKGGGRPHVAQGSAPPTDVSRVERVLNDLLDALERH